MAVEIGLWQSQALRDALEFGYNQPFRAASIVYHYLNRAADEHDDASVDVTTYYDTPDLENEQHNQSFWKDGDYYNHNLEYFREWINDNDRDHASDANLLLTSTSENNGGLGYPTGKFAVARTGLECAAYDYNEPLDDETGTPADAVQTAIHEVGHNIMGDVDQHRTGALRSVDYDDEVVTAMASGYVNTNDSWEYYCCDPGLGCTFDGSGVDHKVIDWSVCCVDNWQ